MEQLHRSMADARRRHGRQRAPGSPAGLAHGGPYHPVPAWVRAHHGTLPPDVGGGSYLPPRIHYTTTGWA